MVKPLDKAGRLEHYEMFRDEIVRAIGGLKDVIQKLESVVALIDWIEKNEMGDE